MATKIKHLKDEEGKFYPYTHESAVVTDDGTKLGDKLTQLDHKVGNLSRLNTTSKSNLVDAINEAAQSGGSTEEIEAAIHDAEEATESANAAAINANNAASSATTAKDSIVSTLNTIAGSGDVPAAVSAKVAAVGAQVDEASKVVVTDKESDKFVFADGKGNIVAEVSAEGIQSVKFLDKDGNEIKAQKEDEVKDISSENESAFVFVDKNGNIVGQITNKGAKFAAVLNRDDEELIPLGKYEFIRNPLNGKKVAIIGDSFKWFGAKLIENTGCSVLYAGTSDKDMISMYLNQAKDVVDRVKNGEHIDYVIYEDVHGVSDKEEGDIPYYVKKMYIGSSYADEKTADAAFSSTFNTVVGAHTPHSMAAIKQLVGSITQKITFSASGAINAGTVTITFNDGSRSYTASTQISAGTSLQDAVNWINEIQYSEFCPYWNNLNHHQTLSEPVLTFTYIGENATDGNSSKSITINTGTTGIAVSSPVFSNSQKAIYRCFGSRDVSEWRDASKWFTQKTYDDNTWKVKAGVIDYLQAEIPNVKIVLIAHSTLAWDFDNETKFYYSDGSVNVDAIHELNGYYKAGMNNIKNIKELGETYNCQVIDIWHNMGISPVNFSTFFNTNDVHSSNPEWYERYANIIATSIK